MLDELGVDSATLPDGARVRVRQHVVVGPRKEDRGEVADWLERTGHGGLVKSVVTAELPKGDPAAVEVLMFATSRGATATLERSVHAQTLKAHVRRELEAGREVPMALLNAHWAREAEVTREDKVFDGE
jgi:hypothetical protein